MKIVEREDVPWRSNLIIIIGNLTTCTFKGKQVPCFLRWSPSGPMTSQFLREVVMELDTWRVIDRIEERKIPFMILDGHGYKMELPFLD